MCYQKNWNYEKKEEEINYVFNLFETRIRGRPCPAMLSTLLCWQIKTYQHKHPQEHPKYDPVPGRPIFVVVPAAAGGAAAGPFLVF